MTPFLAKLIWFLFLAAYFVLRLGPRIVSRKTPVRLSERDGREKTLLLISITGLGLVPLVYLATGFPAFADYPFQPALAWLGILAWIGSLWLFHRTHRDLGRNWSVSLDIREKHALVTTGVYARVRHPMYTAFWLMALAQALMLPNWVAGLSGFVGFGILYFGRLRREEEMMIEAFGEEYVAYMRRTARIIPWVH